MVRFKQFNIQKTLIQSGGGMCPLKPGNRLAIEMVPSHIKLLQTLEDERKVATFIAFSFIKKEKAIFIWHKSCFAQGGAR